MGSITQRGIVVAGLVAWLASCDAEAGSPFHFTDAGSAGAPDARAATAPPSDRPPPPERVPHGDDDHDGLTNADETAAGTDPSRIDSDGDGVTDLGELRGTGTDPLDPSSTIEMGDFFVVLPYDGSHEHRTLTFGTTIRRADVFLLLDMTGSMAAERANLVSGLMTRIIPQVTAAIPDVQFGVGGFDDYPVAPFGVEGGTDLPFYLLRAIGPADEDRGGWSLHASAAVCPMSPADFDLGHIEGTANGRPDLLEAVEGLPCHNGGDYPESYAAALWATATGRGLSWPGGAIADQHCSMDPDDPGERRGYPCFRPQSLPVVLLFGDAPMHDGPLGASPYSFDAPQYDEAVAALREIGARVLPIFSGNSGPSSPFPFPVDATARDPMVSIARDTGTVGSLGTPLIFDVFDDGTGLDTAVSEAVISLAAGTPQDVSTRRESAADNPDGLDATLFIQSVTPVQGYRDGIAGARPGISFARLDQETFYGVIPGTIVEYDVDFHNDVRPPAESAEIFRATIVVLGNGVAVLDTRDVYIIVPPEGEPIFI